MVIPSFWCDVASGTLSTIVGGIFLTALFFWFREKLVPLSQISGHWYFEVNTANSAFKPYRGMRLRYVAMLWMEGAQVRGTVEKIHEKSSAGEITYTGKNRTRGVLTGYVEKRYFSKDRVVLHVVEEGHGRESTNLYDMTAVEEGRLTGVFVSMVADQDGVVVWQRDQF